MSVKALATLVALALVVSCRTADEPTTNGVVTVTDSSGSVPVTTVSGEAPRWHLDSVATLSDTGGEPFSRVRGVLLDDGGAWVVDAGGRAIHRFAADFTSLGVVGRSGGGPGEYEEPYSLGRAGSDLLLYDPGTGRVSRLDDAWSWKEQWAVGRLTGGSDIRFYPGGWLMQFARSDSGGAMLFARFPHAGATDTIWFPPNPKPAPGNFIQCKIADGIRFFTTPFGAPSLLVPTLDGALLGVRGGDYRIVRMRSRGDSVSVIARVADRAPISDAEWTEGTADWTAFAASGKATACEGTLDRPAAKPAVRDMTTDDRGRLWVEQVTPGGVRWEIWDGGTLVGAASAPPRDADVPVAIHGSLVAVTRERPDGGHEVVVYRMREEG